MGIAALIEEHRDAIEQFATDTRESTLVRAAERIRLTKHKIEAYATLLVEERGRLEQALAEASRELRAKIDAFASAPIPLSA